MSKNASNINRLGITNKGFIQPPAMRDKSDSYSVNVRSGATIKKQTPGLNAQIVPLTPTES